MLKNLILGEVSIEDKLSEIFKEIHANGPTLQKNLETLSYIKKFHINIFQRYESKLIYLLGLFYKAGTPNNILEEVYSIYSQSIIKETGKVFTPVQADAFNNIKNKLYFSFSAPTSAGKSYLFRELIKEAINDIVIVVPSRALIAEYISKIKNDILKDDTTVLILQFIEDVNKSKTNRRVFVITPERGKDLFKKLDKFNIDLFLFDEAQISEEYIRGMTFDAFVRRVNKKLPSAKKVFTHPFIENPEAQLYKHSFLQNSISRKYKQNAVGKIYLSHNKGIFTYFSPYASEKANRLLCEYNQVEKILIEKGNVLIYISKNKIYSREYEEEYRQYIELCPKITDIEGLKLIDELREYIGASKTVKSKHSVLIDLMERGVVIHHGSIPLKARLIIEEFVNRNFARICFATATLIQGINMPFDVVWIDNFRFEGSEEQKNLNLKNLIGRAGRSSDKINYFDYGYVVIKESNITRFCDRLQNNTFLSSNSLLDKKIDEVNEDQKDLVEAIQNNTFNDDLNITSEQVERLDKSDIEKDVKFILDKLIIDKRALKADEYLNLSKKDKTQIKDSLKKIYLTHLRKDSLTIAEQSILSTSIPILLWQIQGKSFKEIVSLRYSYLSQRDIRRKIERDFKGDNISRSEYNKQKNELYIKRSTIAQPLPNSNAKNAILFKDKTPVSKIEYDLLVYDTYDYIDKVISLSLSDPLSAAFSIYYNKTKDKRAIFLKNYIKYGTNDLIEIWLLKYGYSFEEIDKIRDYVIAVNQNEISFNPFVSYLNKDIYNLITRYV